MKLKLINVLAIVGIALSSVTVNADDVVSSPVVSPVVLGNSNSFIPAKFTKEGKPMLTFTSFNRGNGTAEIKAVDASIESVADITVQPVANSMYEASAGQKWLNMHWEKVVRDTLNSDNIKEILEQKKYYVLAYYANYSEHSEGPVYGNEETSYEMLPSGTMVIKNFIYEVSNTGCWVEVTCSGKCDVDYTTEVFFENSEYNNSPVTGMPLIDYDQGSTSARNITLTQTLFNDDADFEYLCPIYGDAIINGSDPSYINYERLLDFGYFAYECGVYEKQITPGGIVGFSIKNQAGQDIQTVRFDNSYKATDLSFLSLIVIGGKTYLSCSVKGDDASYSLLYEINNTNSSVKQVGAFKTGVHPTLVSRGENVMVDFEDADNSQVSVAVTDLTGKVMYRKNVDPAAGSLAIPSETMAEGMNIVSVYGDNQLQNSTKIIVK